MSLSRLTLAHCPALSRANSWRLRDDSPAIDVRVRCGSAAEYQVTIALRRSPEAGPHDERAFVRCLDGESWLVASGLYHADLPRLELALIGSPEHTNDAMRHIA